MKIFNHVFNTWLLAQLLHPAIFFAYFSIVLNDPIAPGALISLFVGSFIIASPSLLISFLLLRLISDKKIAAGLSFGLWFFITAISIGLNIFLFVSLFGGHISDLPLGFIMPAFLAAFLSILIRMPLFFYLINSIKKNNAYEDSMAYEN
jgi:hypothetical protein